MKVGTNDQHKPAGTDFRLITVIVFSLYFSWLLAFPFKGSIFFALADIYGIYPHQLIFKAIAAHILGLVLCGFSVKTMQTAKWLFLFSITICFAATGVFFTSPSFLWMAALLPASFMAGGSVAAWGYFLRSSTPRESRIKTIADGLIGSNLLMILINMVTMHYSARAGLALSMVLLSLAFLFALKLPHTEKGRSRFNIPEKVIPSRINKPLAFLCLFIAVITINSGLMYHVQVPAFAHLAWLTSWYWAVPYIIALYIMRNLPRRINRTYILYLAIAMIGLSFIAFAVLDRSWPSYLLVNTLMLGACGVFDLFWWSIMGDMLDLTDNPSKVLGLGLSANVLGILTGGFIGGTIFALDGEYYSPVLLALAVVCIALALLPPLHKSLTALLKDQIYLTAITEMPEQEQNRLIHDFAIPDKFTEREKEIVALLLKGKTYRVIAGELRLSENTVKTHVKNIYAKAGVQSRAELAHSMLELRTGSMKPSKT